MANLPPDCHCHLPPGRWCQRCLLGFSCPRGKKTQARTEFQIHCVFISLPGIIVTALKSDFFQWTHLWISTGPVVPSAPAMLREVDVLWVVQVCIRRVEDGVNHPRLQIQKHCTGNVVLIISLYSFKSNQKLLNDTVQSWLIYPYSAWGYNHLHYNHST